MKENELSSPGAESGAKPSYWAVLPAAVRYDEKLTAGARLLYAEISSLTDQRGYCYASNAYFMALYGISEPTVQRYLRALKAGGYITIEDGDGGSGRRKIFAGVNPLANPVKNDGVTPSKMTPVSRKRTEEKIRIPPKPPRGPASRSARQNGNPSALKRFGDTTPRSRTETGTGDDLQRTERPERGTSCTPTTARSTSWQPLCRDKSNPANGVTASASPTRAPGSTAGHGATRSRT